jgi:hypothetical protein
MPYACRFCIARRGLLGADVATQPATWEGAADHVEREHRYAVRRGDETQDDAEHRLFLTPPFAPLRRAATIVAGLQGADKLVEIIERMGPIIQVHAVPDAKDALDLIRSLPAQSPRGSE